MKMFWRWALVMGVVLTLNTRTEAAEKTDASEAAINVDPKAGGSATVPVSKMNVGWYKNRHDANVKEMEKGKAKFLLIGDSITHIWEDFPEMKGRCPGHPELVKKYFGEFSPINLGFSGDQTQNVLWRLDNLPLNKIKPKMAMIMIGTNNKKNNTPEEIATGAVMIIKKLKETYPQIKILQLAVFPHGEKANDPNRAKVKAVNDALSVAVKDLENVEWLDINDTFLEKDGTLTKAVFYDALHPDREGFDRWGKAVAPTLKKMFKGK